MKPQNGPTQTPNSSSKLFAKCKNPKIMGNIYVCCVISFISFLYITTVILAWMVKMPAGVGRSFYLFFSHLSFLLFLWSFLKTIFTDPGRVPLHWGFYLDDPEHKKRRYCLVCHIFKPERCHHCSVCNRCVLNMDHHCPWINNCVGFYNRKFFILMLFYVVLTTFIILCGQIKVQYEIFEETIDYFEYGIGDVDWALNFFIFVGCVGNLAIFFVIICFFKFHCRLIYLNMTTIEHLDSKRSSGPPSTSTTNYDIGFVYNFYQIFGKNWVLWPFPMFLESGKPVGDGVVWLQRHKEISPENNLDNISENNAGSLRKIGGTAVDDFKMDPTMHKRSPNMIPNVSDLQSYPQTESKKLFPEETTKNYNIMGFTENITMPPSNPLQTSLHHSHQSPQRVAGIVESNPPPKRMLIPAENMMFDERNSYRYSDLKNLDSSAHSAIGKNYDRGEPNMSANIGSPYGLTGYSQPNPSFYRPYEYRAEQQQQSNSDFKSKFAYEKYGYSRFDAGN